jgi:hypothetical protein
VAPSPGRAGRSAQPAAAASVARGGEIAFGVECRGASGPGRRDGLPVAVVDEIAAGEDPRYSRTRRGMLHLHVAERVRRYLAAEQFATRFVPNRNEDCGHVQGRGPGGPDVLDPDAGDVVLAEDVDDPVAPQDRDLVRPECPRCMILDARNDGRRCTMVTVRAKRLKNVASSRAESPPPRTATS